LEEATDELEETFQHPFFFTSGLPHFRGIFAPALFVDFASGVPNKCFPGFVFCWVGSVDR
jgi:hypothetical protein